MDLQTIIIRPVITEKAMAAAAKGKFTFAVQKSASKEAIKRAIGNSFHVTVTGVQTTVIKGKRKRVGQRRTEVTDTVWKRAVVTLKKGEKLDMFEAAGGEAAK